MKHFKYFWYLLRHKYYVFLAGRALYPPVPIWQLLIHDWSKFLPSEWFPYADYFFNRKNGVEGRLQKYWFDLAWNDHQKRNKHHWQYWVLIKDDGDEVLLDIPGDYHREMVADWIGAGEVFGDRAIDWYRLNKNDIKLNVNMRQCVEHWLEEYYEEKI